MINLNELKKTLSIDKYALDEELIRQPSLFFDVSEAYVEALALRDTKKEELATVDAELDAEVRLGNEKITEAKVKSLVQAHPKHEEAFISFNEAKLQADRLGALKEAFSTRAYLLRDLVQLYTVGYFQDASVKETQATGAVVYSRQRERLAENRFRKAGQASLKQEEVR